MSSIARELTKLGTPKLIVDYGALLASAFKDLNPLASEAEQIAAVELQRGDARRSLAS